ncbi:MAG: hypothetical protein D6E12_02160 [Desulfovibrio sp.]|nr:MAG: hypothetical protein D6E12_02160 [Desulfovibrio sp.]
MKRVAGIVVVLMMMCGPAYAGMNVSELMADPAFAALDADARLMQLNQRFAVDEVTTSDISGDMVARFFMDAVVGQADAKAMLDKYAALRAQFPDLPQTYDLEQHLAMQYLASDPALNGEDELARLKMLLQLEENEAISWPAAAPLYKGILADHLASNPEYQTMDHAGRIQYIRHLAADGVVKDLTATTFVRTEGMEMLSELPEAERAAAFEAMQAGLDFFSKSALEEGYVE